MNEIIRWLIGAAFAILALLLGIEKRKTAKVTKAKEKAEDERDQYKVVNKVYQDADQIKDELVKEESRACPRREGGGPIYRFNSRREGGRTQ